MPFSQLGKSISKEGACSSPSFAEPRLLEF